MEEDFYEENFCALPHTHTRRRTRASKVNSLIQTPDLITAV